ncbi:MAG TPA: hypothetical protein VNA25_14330 [Phycisphaerae bacterium]|nr:hypothetical protein [Phycisphaerae bacterium]
MRHCLTICLAVLLPVLVAATADAQELQPIKSVATGKHAEFLVNAKPFFPLMLWLQDARHFPYEKEVGINTIVGYVGKTEDILPYGQKVKDAGMYFVCSFREDMPAEMARELVDSGCLLGWIQGDEPDMPAKASDAVVEPRKGMEINRSTPFFRIVDGQKNSWTVINPLEGGEFTIKLKDKVTVKSLAVWLTVYKEMPVAKEIVFVGDGKEILKATLEKKGGEQKFDLDAPATFKALTVKVTAIHAGSQPWGSIGEVAGYDASGKNVLESPDRWEPRTPVAKVAAAYRKIKAIDKTRPVFMNFTVSFMKSKRGRFDAAKQKEVYGGMSKCADTVGFDTYPIFGSAMFKNLADPGLGLTDLREYAGPGKPLYSWIETNRGSQWMTATKQPPVEPKHTRFETWAAIIRGASAIGYFTHKWFDPDGNENYSQFAPKEDRAMMAELTRLNAQITKLTGPILAPAAENKIEMKMEGGLDCHFKATRHGKHVYIFAQNLDLGPNAEKLKQFQPISPRGGKATFTVQGLAAGSEIEVIDEGRTIKSTRGSQFTDEFGPLGEHIYRIPAEAFPLAG